MPNKLPLDKLRERTRVYLSRIPGMRIKRDEPAAVVLAPVEVGMSRFINVENLPDLEDLPFIPERMRDFAFRYATEYKPRKFWAEDYGVSIQTIEKWLRREGVQAYIAVCRFEQRMFNLAQHTIMQRNVYRTITAILATKITGDTIGSIVSMAKFVYQVLNNPSEVAKRDKGTLNVRIGFPSSPTDISGDGRNPYTRARNVTPKQLEELQEDIDELEIIAEGISDNGDDDE